jgi:outer membrane biosynthesis protein TonB
MAFQPFKLTQDQAARMLAARTGNPYTRKAVRKAVFAEVRRTYPSIGRTKLRVAIENPDNPLYLVLRNKYSGEQLGITTPDPVVVKQAVSPAATPAVAKPAKAAAPAAKPAKAATPAKKTAPAKKVAPAKPAAVTKKTAPAKAVAKKAAPVKAAATPTVKAPAKAAKPTPAKATPAAGYPKEVRVAIGGVRKRLGTAKDAAHEKRLIAAAKKAAGV